MTVANNLPPVIEEEAPKEITFTIKVKDPEALCTWIEENLSPKEIYNVVCYQQDEHYLVTIDMENENSATLIKTFWAI